MGVELNTFWVIYERTLNEWLRYCVGTFWVVYERTCRVFWKKYPQDTLKSSFRANSQFTSWVSWDQSGRLFLNVLSIYPLGKMWANFEKTRWVPFTICPINYSLGKLKSFFILFSQLTPWVMSGPLYPSSQWVWWLLIVPLVLLASRLVGRPSPW